MHVFHVALNLASSFILTPKFFGQNPYRYFEESNVCFFPDYVTFSYDLQLIISDMTHYILGIWRFCLVICQVFLLEHEVSEEDNSGDDEDFVANENEGQSASKSRKKKSKKPASTGNPRLSLLIVP